MKVIVSKFGDSFSGGATTTTTYENVNHTYTEEGLYVMVVISKTNPSYKQHVLIPIRNIDEIIEITEIIEE